MFTVGAAVPKWMIDDGVRALPDSVQPYARDAKRSAAALWNGPIERYGFVRTLRVVSAGPIAATTAGESAAAARCGGLGARVRAYTYFGVPYSEARMVCDSGVVEYRVWRRPGTMRDHLAKSSAVTRRPALPSTPSLSREGN